MTQDAEAVGTKGRPEFKQIALGPHAAVEVRDELREEDDLLPGAEKRPRDGLMRLASEAVSHCSANGVCDLDSRLVTGRPPSQPVEVLLLRLRLEDVRQPVQNLLLRRQGTTPNRRLCESSSAARRTGDPHRGAPGS